MNRMIAATTRLRALGGDRGSSGRDGRRGRTLRLTGIAVLAALVVPLIMSTFAAPAYAADDKPDNYSLYQLASNASSYFSQTNSPDTDKGMDSKWYPVTEDPASGGSMLGYADPEFSLSKAVGWFFAEISGSSQTVKYSTFQATGGDGGAPSGTYSGMLDYAHFGATLNDLGLDTMSSGIGGQIVSTIGGSIMWVLYALALAVGTLFYFIIQLLQLLNPFKWFYTAVAATGSNGQEMASGMTGGDAGGGALAGLQSWISGWYGILQDISWQALVPLFIGFLLLGLVLFKKMDRGSAIKKLIIRVVFIGVGLPLVGSMYTGVLNQFDDSVLGSNAGPTRVVLSNYVDFDSWMTNDRLAVPDGATVSWNGDQSGSQAMMSVRSSALAINKQSHGSTFNGIQIGTKTDDAESAWKDGTVGTTTNAADDVNAVFSTFGIINDYLSSREMAASDFESGIKTNITDLGVDADTKKDWFVNTKTYGDVDDFGGGDIAPQDHPVISARNGLSSSNPGGNSTTFTTAGTKQCGYSVTDGGNSTNPASCNLAPLAAYNYLNTSFGPNSLEMYSSNNATSGFTRENHMAASQVGTGPAKFMYWSNAVTVLSSIVLLGFWYAIGMLAGAVKRTFSLVAAVPFATLGAIQAIAKVIVYTVALILEVVVTLFIYQFVSQFLISIPDIMSGPISSWMEPGGLFGSPVLGGIIVVVLTFISSLVIIGVTFALLRVRKVVLQAMDEVFTKLVDKFLDTNTAPAPNKGGMMPALASGVGAGAGMALGNKLASSGLGKTGSMGATKPGGTPGGQTGGTNAGGTNGEAQTKALSGGPQRLALGPGQDGPDAGSPGGPGGPDRSGPGGIGGGGGPLALGSGPGGPVGPAGQEGPQDGAGPLLLPGGGAGSAGTDKDLARNVSEQGGLSNLGFNSPGGAGTGGPVVMEKGADGTYRPVQAGAGGSTSSGSQRSGGSGQGRGSSPTAPTQFGTTAQGTGGAPGSSKFNAAGVVGAEAPTTNGRLSKTGTGTGGSAPTNFGRTTTAGSAPQARSGRSVPSTGAPRPAQGRPAPAQPVINRPSAPAPAPAPAAAPAPRQAPVASRPAPAPRQAPVQGQRPQASAQVPVQPRPTAQRPPRSQAPASAAPRVAAPAPVPAPARGRRAAPLAQAPAPVPAPQPQQAEPERPRRRDRRNRGDRRKS